MFRLTTMLTTDNPEISIIIPSFNRAGIIQETLNSIIKQSFINWECIIVDDGSSDNTESIINEIISKDNRFKFFKRPSQMRKGANSCRNYGFEQSEGKFIVWFDSDDLMHFDYLQSHLSNLRQAEYNYSICRSKWLTLGGELVDGFRSSNLSSRDIINDYIQFNSFWPINAVCYKREFLENHRLKFDESLQQSQEYDFHVKVLSVDSNYGIIDKQLITIVASENSVSYSETNAHAKSVSSLIVKRRFLSNADRLGLSLKTKYFVLSDMHRIFQQQTTKRNFKTSMYAAFIYLASHFEDKRIAKGFFYRHLLPLLVVSLSYNLTGKGYALFKKSNTFKTLNSNGQ